MQDLPIPWFTQINSLGNGGGGGLKEDSFSNDRCSVELLGYNLRARVGEGMPTPKIPERFLVNQANDWLHPRDLLGHAKAYQKRLLLPDDNGFYGAPHISCGDVWENTCM